MDQNARVICILSGVVVGLLLQLPDLIQSMLRVCTGQPVTTNLHNYYCTRSNPPYSLLLQQTLIHHVGYGRYWIVNTSYT